MATGNGVRLQLNSSEHQAITDLPPPPHLATGSIETKQLQSKPSYDVIPAAAGDHGHAGAAEVAGAAEDAAYDSERPHNHHHQKTATTAAADQLIRTETNSTMTVTLLVAAAGTTLLPKLFTPAHESTIHPSNLPAFTNTAKGKEKRLRPTLKIKTSQNPSHNPVTSTQTRTRYPNSQPETVT